MLFDSQFFSLLIFYGPHFIWKMSDSLIIAALLSFFKIESGQGSGSQLAFDPHCSPEAFRNIGVFFFLLLSQWLEGVMLALGVLGQNSPHSTKNCFTENVKSTVLWNTCYISNGLWKTVPRTYTTFLAWLLRQRLLSSADL